MAALPLSYSTADGRSQLHSLAFILLSIPVVNQSKKKILSSYLLLYDSFVKLCFCYCQLGQHDQQGHKLCRKKKYCNPLTAHLVDILLPSYYAVLIEK